MYDDQSNDQDDIEINLNSDLDHDYDDDIDPKLQSQVSETGDEFNPEYADLIEEADEVDATDRCLLDSNARRLQSDQDTRAATRQGNEVLSFIEDIEKGLSQLRSASAEQASMAEITHRAHSDLLAQQSQVEASREELERDRIAFANHECEIENIKSQIDEQKHRIESQQTALDDRAAEIEQGEQSLQSHQDAINTQEEEINRQQSELQNQFDTLELQQSEFEETKQEIESRTAGLDQQAQELQRSRDEISETQNEFESQQLRIDSQQSEIDEQRTALHQEQERIESLESHAKSADHQIESRTQHLGERESDLTQREQQLQSDLDMFRVEQEDASNSQEQLHGRLITLESQQSAFEEERSAFREERASWQDQRDSAAASEEAAPPLISADELSQLREESAETKRELERAEEELTSARADLREAVFENRADQSSESDEDVEGLKADVDQHIAEIKELTEELQTRDAAISQLSEHFRRVKSELAESQDSLAVREDVIATLQNAAELNEASAETEVDMESDSFLTVRRSRLKYQRELMQNRIKRLLGAKEQLKKQAIELRDAASQRDELNDVRQNLERAEKVMIRRWARSGIMTRLFFFVATLMLLAGSCYFSVLQFAPADYVANATVTAQARPGFPLTEEQLQTWQLVGTETAFSASVLQSTSERLVQRGYDEFRDPEALSAFLKDRLVVESPEAGSIGFSFKGTGKEDTQRILSTFTIAFVSSMNASRGKRIDGAKSKLTTSATLDPVPVKDERLIYAGYAFGGSLLLILPIGLLIYSKLSRAAGVFDPNGDLFEPLIDDSKWEQIQATANGVHEEHEIN